jgi:hypothetical protein
MIHRERLTFAKPQLFRVFWISNFVAPAVYLYNGIRTMRDMLENV